MDSDIEGTNARCEDNSATSLEDKYAYLNNDFDFKYDKNIRAVKGDL